MNTPAQNISASDVEAFLRNAVIDCQKALPEYSSIAVELSRHLHSDGTTSSKLEWVLYTNSNGHTRHANFDELQSQVEKYRIACDPKICAAKLREQAAELTQRANEIEGGAP